jgi:AraC-like DNA-binding protein
VSGAVGTTRRTDRAPEAPGAAVVGVGAPAPARVPSVPVLVRLRLAKDLMDRCYADPLDLNTLAREAGFSRYHFARAFRAAYGEPPGAYLSRRRVERAQDLLRSADITVTEVCLLVGFSSLGSFSSRFREVVGMSPSEYRRRHWAARAPLPVPGCFVLAWSRPGAPTTRSAIQEKPGGRPAD